MSEPHKVSAPKNALDDYRSRQMEQLTPCSMRVLVIGCNGCWAKGDSIEEARKLASNPQYYYAYIVHPESTVDGYGAIVYPSGYAPKQIVRKVNRKTKSLLKKIEAPFESPFPKRTPYADGHGMGEDTGERTLPE